MGFTPQPNSWQCGPYALKHALVTLGVWASEREISGLAGGRRRTGTNERQLARAARAYRCSMPVIRSMEAGDARRTLIDHVDRGIPVLLCVDAWDHWITLVKEERGRFIALDSKDPAVLTIVSWNSLRRRWAFRPKDGSAIFDLHPVLPRFRVAARPHFSAARARFLRRRRNRDLVRSWDVFVDDLLRLSRRRTPLSEHAITFGEFLRRHRAKLLEEVRHWNGSEGRRTAARILNNLRFVADTHGLVVRLADETRAVAGMATLLDVRLRD
jgi:hypothetical protein